MSNKLNKDRSVISLEFIWNVIFLLSIKFIHIVEDAYTTIQSKIKINGFLTDPFTLTQGVCQGCLFSMLLYILVAEVLGSFINVNKRIKGIQIRGHEMKIINFADDTAIFSRDITCLNRIQDASNSKINVSRSHALWAGHVKTELINQEKRNDQNFH